MNVIPEFQEHHGNPIYPASLIRDAGQNLTDHDRATIPANAYQIKSWSKEIHDDQK
jgi:hypothetical protein